MWEVWRLVSWKMCWNSAGWGWEYWRVSLKFKVFQTKYLLEMFSRYVCPKCEPNSRLNFANLKELNSQDRELITKTFKSIQVELWNYIQTVLKYIFYLQSNRYSNPFKEPVDPKGHPKYYEVVKEPMGMFQILSIKTFYINCVFFW